jgi:hypothetical protein
MWLIAAAAAVAIDSGEPALPGWMAGCWEQRSGETWVEECWTGPRGGMMMGSSRSGTGDRVDEWEAMQIMLQRAEQGSGKSMTFWAAPMGAKRTAFAWRRGNEPGVSFYNRDNDFPERIRYWRDGRDLMAEISLEDGSKARRWRYRRMRR